MTTYSRGTVALAPTSPTVVTPAGRALRTPPPVAAVAFIPSSSRPSLKHVVMRSTVGGTEVWGCSCEAGSFRPDRECRHIRLLRDGTAPAGTEITPEGYVILNRIV